MRFKGKKKLMFFCIPLLIASCTNENYFFENFNFLPIENLTIYFADDSNELEYGIAKIQKIVSCDDLLNLSTYYLIDYQDLINYNNYFFEKNNLYLVSIEISGNLLAGISLDNDFAICHVFQLELINEKINNYAFAFSYEKDIDIANIRTASVNVTSNEYDDLKKIYKGKIWEGKS